MLWCKWVIAAASQQEDCGFPPGAGQSSGNPKLSLRGPAINCRLVQGESRPVSPTARIDSSRPLMDARWIDGLHSFVFSEEENVFLQRERDSMTPAWPKTPKKLSSIKWLTGLPSTPTSPVTHAHRSCEGLCVAPLLPRSCECSCWPALTRLEAFLLQESAPRALEANCEIKPE